VIATVVQTLIWVVAAAVAVLISLSVLSLIVRALWRVGSKR
jgi:hypothetical protein